MVQAKRFARTTNYSFQRTFSTFSFLINCTIIYTIHKSSKFVPHNFPRKCFLCTGVKVTLPKHPYFFIALFLIFSIPTIIVSTSILVFKICVDENTMNMYCDNCIPLKCVRTLKTFFFFLISIRFTFEFRNNGFKM